MKGKQGSDEPGKNIVDWAEVRKILEEPPIQEERAAFRACEHRRVQLDDQAHTVTCKQCGKVVDPFWYLQLLAKEWERRKYHLARLDELEAEFKRREAERKAMHDAAYRYTSCPPKIREAAYDAWQRATAALGGQEPVEIHRLGRSWYVGNGGGGETSIDYLEQLASEGGVDAARKAVTLPNERLGWGHKA